MMNEDRVKLLFHTFLIVIIFSHAACSQRISTLHHVSKPHVINSFKSYEQSIKHDINKRLVPLKYYVTPLLSDWKYAATHNFTHRILYFNPVAYARLPVAVALKKVQEELALKGLGLMFFDAYRPYSVTKQMWKVVPDERYAANPSKGSGHNRGAAVDVTLAKISTGEQLVMPTGFDNFSEKAHHSYMNLPESVLKNRALLKTTMEKYGFEALSTEWWHYSLPNAVRFELLDLSFKQLENLKY